MQIEELALQVWPEGDRVTEADLTAFETNLTHLFPDDFRRFLLLSGGGGKLFDPLVYEWRTSSHLGSATAQYAVAEFCVPGGDDYHSIRPLQRHIEDMEYVCSGVPSEMYIIADDWFGNFLTIDLRPETYGQIGLVDHETVGDEFKDDETYVVIASSFSALAAGLREFSEKEPVREPVDPADLMGPGPPPLPGELEAHSANLKRLAAMNGSVWMLACIAVLLAIVTFLVVYILLA